MGIGQSITGYLFACLSLSVFFLFGLFSLHVFIRVIFDSMILWMLSIRYRCYFKWKAYINDEMSYWMWMWNVYNKNQRLSLSHKETTGIEITILMIFFYAIECTPCVSCPCRPWNEGDRSIWVAGQNQTNACIEQTESKWTVVDGLANSIAQNINRDFIWCASLQHYNTDAHSFCS